MSAHRPLAQRTGLGSRFSGVRLLTRRAALLTVALVTGFVSVVATPGTARACSCEASTLAELSSEVTLAFTGRQIQRVLHDEFADFGVTLTFEVDQVFKGESPPILDVVTNAQGSACGISFGDVDPVAVAAFTTRGGLSVSLCGSRVSISELEEVFGPGYDPIGEADDGAGLPWALIGAVAGGAAALAGVWAVEVRSPND